jgi:uncharacterized membrane protein YjgN (DUF898 family)
MDTVEQQGERVSYQFNGKAGEFFGIWIVNIILSIVTLGIYSAWAKVRTYQYFYGNTKIDNHSFSYLATPMQILKGRIIAVILVIAFSIVSSISPVLSAILMIALLIATPFLICSSLRFETRMTSYRNVRFNFTGKYLEAAWCFLLLPVLSIFTLYLLFPYALKRMDQFILSNATYGDKPFKTELSTGKYYSTSLITMALGFGLGFVAMMLFAVVLSLSGAGLSSISETPAGQMPEMQFGILFIFAAYIVIFSLIRAYYQACIRNHIFKTTQIENVAYFDSNVEFSHLAFLQVTNVIALMCTLGLALPWVKIRTAHFFVNYTRIYGLPGKDDVIDKLGDSTSAIGDEVANAFDIDIALT